MRHFRLTVALLILSAATAAAGKQVPPDADESDFASGQLHPFGQYLARQDGATVTLLSDGSVLVYGFGQISDRQLAQEARTRLLRSRHERAAQSGADVSPKWWDPARRGWRRMGAAPECEASARYLHTATAMSDGKVLIAGGLCDRPKMADDPSPFGAQAALSLWDSRSRRWLAAPSLQQARIYHTASLMPDGSVIVAGGETDPGLTPAPAEPVLASIESFAANEVRQLPPLATARARHTATVLADGGLLVAGGFDEAGRAIASAELWDPAAQAWHSLPPLRFARYSHSATTLADGRVLVAGGIGAEGAPLSSVEIWDPARRSWLPGPPLPIPLYEHAAARVASGQVLVVGGAWFASHQGSSRPWAWSWREGADDWEVAAYLSPSNDPERPDGVSLFPQSDGSAMVFTPLHIMRWYPRGAGGAGTAPTWQSRPSMAVLPDGRVMVVGREAGDFGNGAPKAHLWDPANDVWSNAGTLTRRSWMHEATLALGDGRVVHVGIDGDRNFNCEIWAAAENAWRACGSTPLEARSNWPVEAGLLPDGRPFAIANLRETLVFDEARNGWQKWPTEWKSGIPFGVPVLHAPPLAQILDEATGRWQEINEAAARYRRSASDDPASLLWDAKAAQWAYVFRDWSMGGNARFLPDGCAISTQPLAVFDPATAKVTALVDPGFGIDLSQAAMLVLADGTVVVAGVAASGGANGAGFFHRKASCAGFAEEDDRRGYIAGGLARDEPAVARRPAPTEPLRQPGRLERLIEALRGNASMLPWLGGLLLALLVLRRLGVKRVAGGPASWLLRLLAWGVALAVVVTVVPSWLTSSPPEPTFPCRMIGVWSSQQTNLVHRVELKDDGTYVFEPSPLLGGLGKRSGYWSVQGSAMLWRDSASGPVDANPMQAESDTRFVLTEQSGKKTVYELIRAVPSTRCKP